MRIISKNKNKALYTNWYCPNGAFGHFSCQYATQKDIDEHLKECQEKNPMGIKIDQIPKCQLTVTGSHIWKGIYERVWLDSEQEYRFEYKGYERCLACQLVNNLNN